MQPPAAGEAQYGGGEHRTVIGLLDDAEVLLHQPAGQFQRIAGQGSEIPGLAGQRVVQQVAVAR